MCDNKKSCEKRVEALENAYFIAISINVDEGRRHIFKKKVEAQLNRELEPLVRREIVKECFVFSHEEVVEKYGDFPVWHFLILLRISHREQADAVYLIVRLEKFDIWSETIRMELLETTPNSTYPIPGEKAQKRDIKPFYVVEYVAVQKEHLNDFRQIMIDRNGPAMRYVMEHAAWCYNFYALETISVFYHNPKYPTWNQVHVIGLYPEAISHYAIDFSKGLEQAGSISFEENFKKLNKIRTMPYKAIGAKLV